MVLYVILKNIQTPQYVVFSISFVTNLAQLRLKCSELAVSHLLAQYILFLKIKFIIVVMEVIHHLKFYKAV